MLDLQIYVIMAGDRGYRGPTWMRMTDRPCDFVLFRNRRRAEKTIRDMRSQAARSEWIDDKRLWEEAKVVQVQASI